MNRIPCICGAATVVLLACTFAAAQQQDATPAPAASAPLFQQGSSDQQEAPADQVSPDRHPLSGAQLLTLGTSEAGHNTLTPAFHFAQTFDTHSQLQNQSIGLQGISSFGGSLMMDRTTKDRELKLQYNGGSVIYSDTTDLNSSYHQFGISETIRIRRWSILLSDDAAYSPESPLNGATGAFGGFGDLGSNAFAALSGISPDLLPNQSIYTLRSSRVTNTATGQVGYNFTERTTWTASFGYGLLRFTNADLLDSNQWMFRSGVTHALNAKDSIALNYTGEIFTYLNLSGQVRTHSIQASYARRLTGRLSWQVAGGPQLYTSDMFGPAQTNVTPSGSTSLQYSRARNNFNLGFMAGVGNGAGVLVGSRTYTVTGGATRQWTRNWSTSTGGGYSRNDALTGSTSFDSAFASAQVSRLLGRSASLYVSYTWQKQLAANLAPALASDFVRHVIGFGFDWHFRPIRLGR